MAYGNTSCERFEKIRDLQAGSLKVCHISVKFSSAKLVFFIECRQRAVGAQYPLNSWQ